MTDSKVGKHMSVHPHLNFTVNPLLIVSVMAVLNLDEQQSSPLLQLAKRQLAGLVLDRARKCDLQQREGATVTIDPRDVEVINGRVSTVWCLWPASHVRFLGCSA